MSWFYLCFWVFVLGMLFWQFQNYNSNLTHEYASRPAKEEHFFYYTNHMAHPQPAINGPILKQISYSLQYNSPGAGMITARFTVQNTGNVKARNIVMQIFPYQGGVRGGDVDDGHTKAQYMNANDPIVQINQSVNLPDLAPGETTLQTASFYAQTDVTPGDNPVPQFTFTPDTPKP